MITKERLEELIKQGATVVVVVYNGKSHHKLMVGDCVKGDCALLGCIHVNLHHIYETDEQADWALKVHCERWEFFEPPMWEDIEKDGYLFTFIKPKDIHTIAFAVNWGVLWENEIVILYDDDYYADECRIIFNELATKENYIKACEMVRDLFKGGGNNGL